MSIIQHRAGIHWVRVPFTNDQGRLRSFRNEIEAREALVDFVHEVAEEHAFNPNVSVPDLSSFRIVNKKSVCHKQLSNRRRYSQR